MKLNIEKLLLGGGVFFSAAPNPSATNAQTGQSSAAPSTSSSKGKMSTIVSESLLKDLVEKSLPNDNRKFQSLLIDLESEMERTGRVDKRKLYTVRTYANLIIQQYNAFKKATDTAINQGAWDEIAVDPRGYLFTLDSAGKVQKVLMSKFKAGQLPALTVGELAQYRQEADLLIDRSDIVTTIGNNIGMEKISAYILNIIEAVGNSDTASEAYVDLASIVGQLNAKRPDQRQLTAIKGIAKELLQLGSDAIFKLKETNSDPNILAALSYILSVLPTNMRNQLEGRYIAAGGDYNNKDAYTRNLVLTALAAGTDAKYTFGIDYDSAINKAAGNNTDKGTPKTHNLTMAEVLFNGDLNNQSPVTISDPNYKNRYVLLALGTVIPSLVTDNNNSITNVPLSVALEGKGLGKYLDYGNISVGFDRVSPGMLQNIAYVSDLVANVWLPTNSNGDIDWNSLHAYSAAEEQIKSQGITDINKKNLIHLLMGSPVRYDAAGNKRNTQRTEQFLMTHGYTIDDHVSSANTLVRELTGSEEDEVDQVLSTIYNKKLRKNTGIEMANKLKWDDIIQVPVFIKVQPNAALNAATFAGYGSLVTNSTLEQDMLNQLPASLELTAPGAELYQE